MYPLIIFEGNINNMQMARTHLLTFISSRARINPVLASLHWLPVRHQIIYKMDALVYNIRSYLMSTVPIGPIRWLSPTIFSPTQRKVERRATFSNSAAAFGLLFLDYRLAYPTLDYKLTYPTYFHLSLIIKYQWGNLLSITYNPVSYISIIQLVCLKHAEING